MMHLANWSRSALKAADSPAAEMGSGMSMIEGFGKGDDRTAGACRRAARTARAAPRFPFRASGALGRTEYRVDRQRLADQIALGKLASKLAQARELSRSFDALGNHVAAQGGRHGDDGAHD